MESHYTKYSDFDLVMRISDLAYTQFDPASFAYALLLIQDDQLHPPALQIR